MATIFEPLPPHDAAPGSRYHPLVVLLCAASAGIVLDRYWPRGLGMWWMLSAVALVLWYALFRRQCYKRALCTLLIACSFVFAAAHHAHWHLYRDDDIGRFHTLDVRPARVEATALTNVRWRPRPEADPLRIIPEGDTCRLLLQIHAIRDGDRWQPVTGRTTLIVEGHLLGVKAGDRLQILAHATRIAPPDNPGEYDAADHARVERQSVRLSAITPECVQVVRRGSGWWWRTWIAEIRERGSEHLWRNIAPERAGLAAGLLLGAREQIDFEQSQQFMLTGTVHLLAISGMHLGILMLGFWLVMRTGVLPRKVAIALAVAFVMVYTLMADFNAPIVRSAMLVAVVSVGQWLGRPVAGINALAACGLIVVGFNPAELFEVGTQFSFLAVATLILSGPMFVARVPVDPLKQLIANSRPWLWRVSVRFVRDVWHLWLTGLLIWLVALPLTLNRFHVLPLSAQVLNLVLWLPILLAMYCGFATLTVGWIMPALGEVLGKLTDVALWMVSECIRWGEQLPGSYYWLPGPSLWWTVTFYLSLGAYVALGEWRPPRRWAITLLVLWIAVGFATSPRSPLNVASTRHQELRCTFVAVGHGTSCLIEFPDGYTMLYDAGHMGSPYSGARSISAVLWSRGITRLDAIVLSHADSDHYNAAPELLKRFSVGVVYTSPTMFENPPAGVKLVRDAIDHRHIPLRIVHGSQRLQVGERSVCEVLHPPEQGVVGSDNANSIVLAIEYAGRRLLLPGDLERNGLADLLAEKPLHSEIVMAPHHGSAASNPRGFAQWSTPQYVVISGARSRDATEVIDAYRSFGAEVLHTAHDGALEFVITPNALRVSGWQDDAWQPRQRH